MIHTLKVKDVYFAALLDRTKRFEVRRNDRGFQVGDTLHFVETSPALDASDRFTSFVNSNRSAKSDPSPYVQRRTLNKTIDYVYSGDPDIEGHGGLQEGYVVLGLGY